MSKLHTDADKMMDDIANGPPLMRALVIAVVIHVAIIGVTSIPYFMKVANYGTWDVREAVQAELEQAEEAARTQRIADRKAQQAKKGTAKKSTPKMNSKSAESAKPQLAPSPGDVIKERPTGSSLDIDSDFGL